MTPPKPNARFSFRSVILSRQTVLFFFLKSGQGQTQQTGDAGRAHPGHCLRRSPRATCGPGGRRPGTSSLLCGCTETAKFGCGCFVVFPCRGLRVRVIFFEISRFLFLFVRDPVHNFQRVVQGTLTPSLNHCQQQQKVQNERKRKRGKELKARTCPEEQDYLRDKMTDSEFAPSKGFLLLPCEA